MEVVINFKNMFDYNGDGQLTGNELLEEGPSVDDAFIGQAGVFFYPSSSPTIRTIPDTTTDTDNDGWPDFYETEHFGTNPDSGLDFPRPRCVLDGAGGEAVFGFPVYEGLAHCVQRSADLADWRNPDGSPGAEPIYTAAELTGYLEVRDPAAGRGFFRVAYDFGGE